MMNRIAILIWMLCSSITIVSAQSDSKTFDKSQGPTEIEKSMTEAMKQIELLMDTSGLDILSLFNENYWKDSLDSTQVNPFFGDLFMEGIQSKDFQEIMEESMKFLEQMDPQEMESLMNSIDPESMHMLFENLDFSGLEKMFESMDMSELNKMMEDLNSIDMSELNKMLEGLNLKDLNKHNEEDSIENTKDKKGTKRI